MNKLVININGKPVTFTSVAPAVPGSADESKITMTSLSGDPVVVKLENLPPIIGRHMSIPDVTEVKVLPVKIGVHDLGDDVEFFNLRPMTMADIPASMKHYPEPEKIDVDSLNLSKVMNVKRDINKPLPEGTDINSLPVGHSMFTIDDLLNNLPQDMKDRIHLIQKDPNQLPFPYNTESFMGMSDTPADPSKVKITKSSSQASPTDQLSPHEKDFLNNLFQGSEAIKTAAEYAVMNKASSPAAPSTVNISSDNAIKITGDVSITNKADKNPLTNKVLETTDTIKDTNINDTIKKDLVENKKPCATPERLFSLPFVFETIKHEVLLANSMALYMKFYVLDGLIIKPNSSYSTRKPLLVVEKYGKIFGVFDRKETSEEVLLRLLNDYNEEDLLNELYRRHPRESDAIHKELTECEYAVYQLLISRIPSTRFPKVLS